MQFSYQNRFRKYLDDLAARAPAPGGGSAAGLICCVGISLIEMALRFSVDAKEKKYAAYVRTIEKVKKKALVIVDKDAFCFSKALRAKGPARPRAYKELEKISFALGEYCITINTVARRVRPAIKKIIVSDFDAGIDCVMLACSMAVKNLEENAKLGGFPKAGYNRLKRHLKTYTK
jgi:formiminotetrahydrofolate cyclodeaminase